MVIPLLRDGMFMDAVQYTAVAHNMSQGYGTFWQPEFSMRGVSGYAEFYEQPPLGIFLLSVFYNLFGDSMYVERVFVLLCLICTIFLIRSIWKNILREHSGLHSYFTLPVFLFCCVPIIIWTYDSFMLENVMVLWILGAVLFQIRSMHGSYLFNVIFAGICIFLATFTKGIPGLFPLCLPFLLGITKIYKRVRVIKTTVLLIATVVIIYLVLFCIPDARNFYRQYFLDRTVFRLDNMPTVQYRGYILLRLILELLPISGITAILVFLNRKKQVIDKQLFSWAFVFLLLGIAGSLPMMLTRIQKGFYLVPAMPFFALGLALIIVCFVRFPVLSSIGRKQLHLLQWSIIILLSVAILYQAKDLPTPNRDADLLHDLKALSPHFAEAEIIYSPNAMWNNWPMQCYLMRYYNKHMDEGFRGSLVIVDSHLPLDIPSDYDLIQAPTKRYQLYTSTK